ncbi:PREDICTED: uncharacterized protein LOC104715477 [Camelina sativa]|uniref:Uncharacterized protein LOC104715477 n=1 Tax=Camelina sativa TaxID=90675 RepID=A0ABM0TTL0_CAMSA|nr:PREDICTED: uncharacterized protein LOC104715477 [Camelina sativa]
MAAPTERVFGVTNIKSHMPLILDMDDHNYDAWRELFLSHCLTFDVLGHVDGSSTPATADDQPWLKRDGLVKLWIYGTLAQPLFKSTFKTGDLLSNLEAPVNDRNLVMYMLNGLNEKFDNIINVIKHQKPFPSFDDTKSMLQDEECRLKKAHKVIASHSAHASSPTALVTMNNSNQTQQNQSTQHKTNRPWRRNNCGNYKGRNNFQQTTQPPQQQRQPFPSWGPYWPSPYNKWQPPQFAPWGQYPTNFQNCGLLGPKPVSSSNVEAHIADLQPTRDFAEAFNTMTLTEPSTGGWYMDTGATAHLASSPDMLHSIFNLNTKDSVIVGDSSSIPVSLSGFTSLPSKSRPLNLHNVLITPTNHKKSYLSSPVYKRQCLYS